MSSYSGSPLLDSTNNRPSSITRSSRENFVAVLESLPSESTDYTFELNEEVLNVEDFSEDDSITGEQDDIIEDTEVKGGKSKICISNHIDAQTARDGSSPVRLLSFENEDDRGEKNLADNEIDPKIRKGLKKIRKLDQILNDKVDREIEVKKSRRMLEQKFQTQVTNLFNERGAEKIMGSQQLLRLCASSDRKDYVANNEIIESIFSTQIDSEYYQDKKEEDGSESVDSNAQRNENSNKKAKKDFLKRNIELAARAKEIVQLTEKETKRLDELLSDDSDLLMVENPFTVPSTATVGYQFTTGEQQALLQIDAQLKDLVPSDEYTLSICDSQSNRDEESDCGKSINSSVFNRESECGEGVLQQGHSERMTALRLRSIEEKLSQLHFEEEEEDKCIDPDLLRKLLDVDSRLTSDAISICESLRTNSSLFGDVDVDRFVPESDDSFRLGSGEGFIPIPTC